MTDELEQLRAGLERAVKTVSEINDQLYEMRRRCTAAEADLRHLSTYSQPRRFLRVREVAERFGVGRSTIYRWVHEGLLPGPHKLSTNCVRWLDSEIDTVVERMSAGHVRSSQ